MRKSRIAGLACLMLTLGSCASLVAPRVAADPVVLKSGAYALDLDHGSLLFKVSHLGFSLYVGRFNRFDATLDFDADDVSAAHVEAKIDMASLDVAHDDFAATLTDQNWFDAGAYPEALFVSTAIEKTGDKTGRMTGDLTLKGVTRPVTAEMTWNGSKDAGGRFGVRSGFDATFTIKRSEFGMDTYVKEGGLGDEVTIMVGIEGAKES